MANSSQSDANFSSLFIFSSRNAAVCLPTERSNNLQVNMGRRRQGVGGRSSSVFERDLRRHVEKSWLSNKPTTDQLVEKLRASFPEYARQKLQPYRRRVQEIQEQIKNTPISHRVSERDCPSTSDVNDTDDDSSTPSNSPARKRIKKMDKSEQRLLDLETQHILRKQKNVSENPNEQSSSLSLSCSSTSSSESSSSSSSASPSESSDEEDSAVSTSEDVVYEEHQEPEFDLKKSMLRKSYSGSKNAAKPKNVEDKNVKYVVVGTKASKKAVRTKGYAAEAVGLKLEKDIKVNDDVGEEKGKDGPRFKDLGGMSGVLDELKMEVIVPLYHPQLPRWLGVRPMAGILLHGPPGCGKTKLAHAIANETGVPFYKISATELVSGVSGASEENIRELFTKAYRTAPSIVFIDEIDAIASKRENLQREMERRIVTQLMTCMDESQRVAQPTDTNADSDSSAIRPGYVLVIGATNRPDAVDPALRRPGRFDREIALGVPDENARVEILTVITQSLKLEGSFDLVKIGRATPGFVGADLAALANKAGNLAMKRIIDQRKCEISTDCLDEEKVDDWWKKPWSSEEMQNLSIKMADFEEAAKMVQPSSRREGFSSIPNVKWEDVGGLDLLRHEFDRYIVRRIKYPEDYQEFGVDLETGFLLYGPPGCGKTLIAKAVANEAGANFIHIKGPEILNKYVGESELAVRTIFSRARTCSPCVLFFDEVDALTTKRGKEGGWVVERLLNQLLIELDGADQRRGVYVIGATNRPEVMDQAILRPGRLGKLLYVPLPNPDERGLILKALAKKKPIDASVDLVSIGRSEACSNLSGADLSALMNEAAMAALDEKLVSLERVRDGIPTTIKGAHFERAFGKISPSVSDKQKQCYNRLSESFGAA